MDEAMVQRQNGDRDRTVGFEAHWAHHVGQCSWHFAEMSANTVRGDHMETRSELCSCGQLVGECNSSQQACIVAQDIRESSVSRYQ